MVGGGLLHLIQVFPQEHGVDAAGAEHARRPLHVVAEGGARVAFNGGGEELHVKARVLDPGLARPIAVSRHPVRMFREERVGDRFRERLLVASERATEGRAIRRRDRVGTRGLHGTFLYIDSSVPAHRSRRRLERVMDDGRAM